MSATGLLQWAEDLSPGFPTSCAHCRVYEGRDDDPPAHRNGELVADFASERAGLREFQMMRIARRRCSQTRHGWAATKADGPCCVAAPLLRSGVTIGASGCY